jgi:hypothetical protein
VSATDDGMNMKTDDTELGPRDGKPNCGSAQPRPPNGGAPQELEGEAVLSRLQAEQLLADYVAGQDVPDGLLRGVRSDAALADLLAGHLEVERLLRLEAEQTDEELFAREVAARLRHEGDERFIRAVAQRIRRPAGSRGPRWLRYAAAAALAVALTGGLLFSLVPPRRATVAQQTAAVWEDAAYRSGDTIRRRELTLREGCAELTLANGVRLILEAPVTLDLSDTRRVVLKSGSLVATVPRQAQGFTVITPSSEVVDLGTAFGVSVDKGGGSEVCVLEGTVKARGSSAQSFVRMGQDEACAFDPDRQMTVIRGDPARFLRALPGRSSAKPEYLHWSFDRAERTAACAGPGIQGRLYDGKLKALGQGEGPVVQKGVFGDALYFNGRDAYVETDFPGIGGNAPRTVAFWAKVPEGDIEHSGYAMIGWGLMQPGAAWQISANPFAPEGPLGRIRIGTMEGMVIGSTDLRDNRWHHVAIVMYGGDAADTSTHILIYVDGKLEKSSRKSIIGISTTLDDKGSQPLRFGRNLGFTDEAKPVPDRFFNGWLDEVHIFDTALDPQQIVSLMKKNRI